MWYLSCYEVQGDLVTQMCLLIEKVKKINKYVGNLGNDILKRSLNLSNIKIYTIRQPSDKQTDVMTY